MTKHRNRKQAARATQAATGTNYTTALRHHALAAPAHRFLIPLGTSPDHTAVALDLGGPTTGPVTLLGGVPGSGKTVAVEQIVTGFLAQNPIGQVLWVDPKGVGPDDQHFDARVTSLTHLAHPTAAAAIAALHEPTGTPRLVVVEEIGMLPVIPGGPALWDTLVHLARTGRATETRILATSPSFPSAATLPQPLRQATHARIWVGRADPLAWRRFFTTDAQAPADCATAALGHGWVAHGTQPPTPVRVPPPTFRN